MRNSNPIISVLNSTGKLLGAPPTVPTFYAIGTDTTPTLYKSINGVNWTSTTSIVGAIGGGKLAVNPAGAMLHYRTNGVIALSTDFGINWNVLTNAGGNISGGPTSTLRWYPGYRRWIASPYNGTFRTFVSERTASDVPGSNWEIMTVNAFNNNLVVNAAPNGLILAGNVISNGTPQMVYRRENVGGGFSTTTVVSGSNGFGGVKAITYSPVTDRMYLINNGVSTSRVAIFNPTTTTLEQNQVIQTFDGPAGLFFWSNVLQKFVRTNDGSALIPASQFIYLSDDAVTWSQIDLGSIVGLQRDWAESNDEVVLFTTNNKVVVIRSPTDVQVVNTTFNSAGGACFIP
jgi:hypothetical protein